nr:hypothetical protein Iba_chr04aCG25450 [Ipomoea batatas]GMC87345.1 hypothetical protein Iba_chr04dCG19260 [Ipomoea batatas]
MKRKISSANYGISIKRDGLKRLYNLLHKRHGMPQGDYKPTRMNDFWPLIYEIHVRVQSCGPTTVTADQILWIVFIHVFLPEHLQLQSTAYKNDGQNPEGMEEAVSQ